MPINTCKVSGKDLHSNYMQSTSILLYCFLNAGRDPMWFHDPSTVCKPCPMPGCPGPVSLPFPSALTLPKCMAPAPICGSSLGLSSLLAHRSYSGTQQSPRHYWFVPGLLSLGPNLIFPSPKSCSFCIYYFGNWSSHPPFTLDENLESILIVSHTFTFHPFKCL